MNDTTTRPHIRERAPRSRPRTDSSGQIRNPLPSADVQVSPTLCGADATTRDAVVTDYRKPSRWAAWVEACGGCAECARTAAGRAALTEDKG